MSYYNEAVLHERYMQKSSEKSSDFRSEKDDKYSGINTLNNNNKNIEDRYYGESNKTYNDDKKYFQPLPTGDDNTLYYIAGSLLVIFMLIKT
jgi:hypothetical protein